MRKIAMVGTASSGISAPYHDLSWEIWGVSSRHDYVKRATRWFELHRLDGEGEEWANAWRTQMKERVTHDCEVMMIWPEPNLGPRVVKYPVERISAKFGTYFMTSTFSWMMALAIDEWQTDPSRQPMEIGLWGVDMEYGTEYREQRAGLRHYIALAKQLGITVSVLANGGLAYEPVPYPLWQDDPLLAKNALRTQKTEESLNNLEESLDHTRTSIAQQNALLTEFTMMKDEDYDVEERVKQTTKLLSNLNRTASMLSKDITHLQGVLGEQKWLRDYLLP